MINGLSEKRSASKFLVSVFRIIGSTPRYSLLILLLVIATSQREAHAEDVTHLNVVEFGATPNDSVDDTEAIQSAINAASDPGAPSTGKPRVVFIPAGTFLVKGLTISANNIQIRGMGSAESILKHTNQASPVIHLKGACYTTLQALSVAGSSSSTYGILIDDTSTTEPKGGRPAWKGVLSDVNVSKVMGNPGIGLANTDRAHSWSIRYSTFRDNRVGIKLIKRSQNTSIEGSSIIFNLDQQLILGDGAHFIRGINIRDSHVEGTNVGTKELIRVDGISPLNIDAIYLESHRGAGALDLLTVNLPSDIAIDGLYSNGGVAKPISQSFLFKTATSLSLKNAQFIGTMQAISVAESDPDYPKAVPAASRIQINGSRGPGIKNGLGIRQGGDAWGDGLSLTHGKHTWDIVTGREGFLWFGYNGKTKAILLPDGTLKQGGK